MTAFWVSMPCLSAPWRIALECKCDTPPPLAASGGADPAFLVQAKRETRHSGLSHYSEPRSATIKLYPGHWSLSRSGRNVTRTDRPS